MSVQELYVKEGVRPLSVGESFSWTLTTTPWGSSPTVSAFLLLNPSEQDVTATQTSGSESVNGDDIITRNVVPTTAGRYRWILTFTTGGQTLKGICDLDVTDPTDFVV